jgi:RNA polymerase sigma-70 factor (ECF subfamily)
MATLSIPHPTKYLHESTIFPGNYPEPEVQDSLEQLYAEHRDFIYRVALRVTHNAGDAEDVVQNVFLRMMRTDKRPDVGRCATAYFRRAATNTAIDLIRQRATRAETTLPPFHPAAQQTLLEHRHVRQVLGKLAPKDATLFELHYSNGYLYRELAERFGLQVGTVKSRLHRIRAELQDELQAA